MTEPTIFRAFKVSSAALTQLMKRMQAQAGGGLRWFAVAEWQARGAVHWHVLIAGVVYASNSTRNDGKGRAYPGHPRDTPGHRLRKWDDLLPTVMHYGFGEQVDIHAVAVRPEDSAEEVASYLGKYLTKGEDMARLPKGSQPVRCSRGRNAWAPGYTLTSLRDERRDIARARAAEAVA